MTRIESVINLKSYLQTERVKSEFKARIEGFYPIWENELKENPDLEEELKEKKELVTSVVDRIMLLDLNEADKSNARLMDKLSEISEQIGNPIQLITYVVMLGHKKKIWK